MGAKRWLMIQTIFKYGMSEFFAKGLNVILLSLVLPALLDIESYGQVAIIIAIEMIFLVLLTCNQNTVMLRLYSSFKGKLFHLYSVSFGIVLIMAAVLLILYVALFATNILNFENIKNYTILFIIIAAALQGQFALYLAYLRKENRVDEYGISRICYQIVKFCIVAGGAVILRDVTAYPLGILVSNIVVFVFIGVRNRHRFTTFRVHFSEIFTNVKSVFKDNMHIALPLTISSLITSMYTFIDRFILQYFLTMQQVGVYNFALTLGNTIYFFVYVLSLSYVPVIYENKEYDHHTAKLLRTFLIVAMLTSLGAVVVIYFFIFPFTLQFVPSDYEDGRVVLLLASGAMVINTLTLYGTYTLISLRKVILIPILTLGALIIKVILNYFFIPLYGINGSGMAVILSEFLHGLSFIIVARVLVNRNRSKISL